MLKKIMCILSTLIILVSMFILPASADDTSTSIKSWNVENWQSFFGADCDVTKLPGYETYVNDYFKTNGYVVNNSIILGSNFDGVNPGVLTLYVTDGEFNIKTGTLNSGNPCYDISGASNSTYIASLTIWKNSRDIFLSKSVSLGGKYTHLVTSDKNLYIDSKIIHFYYSENPYQSFLDYLNISNIDLNPIVPPEGFNKSAIKYSNSNDCPYGKYNYKPYKNDMENYETAGLFTDLKIYYDSDFNYESVHDHSETIDFYIDVSDVFVEHYGYTLFDYYNYGWDLPDLNVLFKEHFRVVHYEKDSYTPLEFFNSASGTSYSSLGDFFTVAKVGEQYFLKFSLKSEYSIINTGVSVEPGSSNLTNNTTIFSGKRITHTCSHINPDTGDIGASGNGLGSDISQADDNFSRPPTKDELENLGFNRGYPNTSGNYPYKVTIYRNGSEYVQMYFNSMPSVSSTYYSNKCIDYGVNVNNRKIYIYFKEQHMSKIIDFTTNEDDMYYSDGHFFENPITDGTLNILNNLLNVDTSEFSNTYTLHMWTNYTGEFPDNMNGFYCKFNWNLENSGHFQKNNSDDDYDYTQDYIPEDSFTDNNGNIHGGAVEPPTEDPLYNGFNNQDFSFDENSLWEYADSFLGFCARAFKVLPNFIWQLIGCSMVIVIVLRIAGR
ncbi:MAG: hypothetical protein U0L18_02870 [Acutalibacteraceae bacterium]|nr:hypothetical protein [Acutalibacteraceae bacterium]